MSERTRDAVVMVLPEEMPVNTADPSKLHWAVVLCNNIAANYPQQHGVTPTIRCRKILHKRATCYGFKQSLNRVRITVVPHHANVDDPTSPIVRLMVLVYQLPAVNPLHPRKPRYGYSPTIRRDFSYPSDMANLTNFLVESLSMENEYSAGTSQKIKTTTDPKRASDSVFLAGKITTAIFTDDCNWNLLTEDGNEIVVHASALPRQNPCRGYWVIAKNADVADVLTEADYRRYYVNIDKIEAEAEKGPSVDRVLNRYE